MDNVTRAMQDQASGLPLRALLPKSKLQEFMYWLELQGVNYRPGRGPYQALQVLLEEPTGCTALYASSKLPEHFHCTARPLIKLVQRFKAEQAQAQAKAQEAQK